MRTIPAVILAMLIAFAPLRAADVPGDELAIVRVETRDQSVIAELAKRHSHLLIAKEKGLVIFEADRAELAQLRSEGLNVAIEEAATAAQRGAKSSAPGALAGIINFPCYRTVVEANARFDALLAQYPQLVRVVDIGDSWERSTGAVGGGEDLRVIKLTNANISGIKPKVFLMTGLHAREYTPVEVGLRLVEWLLANYGENADATWLLDHQELHVLVQSNPDGRKRAEQGASWRKNTNIDHCPAGRRGADLNRNYPFEWGAHGGSSGDPCMDTFRGPSTSSEPETQAVINYVRTQFADSRGPLATDAAPADTSGLFFDVHSYSKLVLWPWGYTNQVPPNGPALETLGRRFAWFNGYSPEQAVDLYVTDGTTDDFAYGELGVAAYTFELGNHFFESCAAFESTVFPDNFAALRYALRVARAPYQLPAGPEAREVAITPDISLPGEAFTVSGTLDDTRFNQSLGGTEPSHVVTSANVYVQLAPWQVGASPIVATASDGAFDEANEGVAANVSGAGLGLGKHLIYLQGRDASGSAGPVAAAFADIRAPADIGSVSGSVRNSRTQTPIAAEVRASGFVSRSGIDGAYLRRLPPGTHRFEVSADEYESVAVDGIVVTGGGAIARDFALLPLCALLGEDAEGTAAGWTLQSPWAIVNGDAGHASRYFTDSPGGNYANSSNIIMTSPATNLTGYENPVLSFEARCDTEAGFDFGIVEVRTSAAGAGSTWTEIHRCDNKPQWQQIRVAAPLLAGAAQAQVRFRFTSDTSQVRDGWSIDNITLKAGGPACRAAIPSDAVFANGFE
ncbi:MAG: M14 family zinc carboxypeptidase [Lysobacterales bacterium]